MSKRADSPRLPALMTLAESRCTHARDMADPGMTMIVAVVRVPQALLDDADTRPVYGPPEPIARVERLRRRLRDLRWELRYAIARVRRRGCRDECEE